MITVEVVYPGNDKVINTKTDKVIFLAGPIQGAEDWQKQVEKIIKYYYNGPGNLTNTENANIIIANPRRAIAFEKDNVVEYKKQVHWEEQWLYNASITGCVMFWLAAPIDYTHLRTYAQTTRFELGEWFAKEQYNDIGLVIGIEPGFPGKEYIVERINDDSRICHSLANTIKAALQTAFRTDTE
jgi:hypothetical protein